MGGPTRGRRGARSAACLQEGVGASAALGVGRDAHSLVLHVQPRPGALACGGGRGAARRGSLTSRLGAVPCAQKPLLCINGLGSQLPAAQQILLCARRWARARCLPGAARRPRPAAAPESGPNMGWVQRMSTSGGSSRSSRRLGNSLTDSTSTNRVDRFSRCTGSLDSTCGGGAGGEAVGAWVALGGRAVRKA